MLDFIDKKNETGRSLLLAGLAAIGASVCCVGPLLLLMLGIGGAWVSALTAMEPLRPILSIATLGLLAWVFRNLYLLPNACDDDKVCANTAVQRNQRIIFWVVAAVLIALLAFPYYAEYIVE